MKGLESKAISNTRNVQEHVFIHSLEKAVLKVTIKDTLVDTQPEIQDNCEVFMC